MSIFGVVQKEHEVEEVNKKLAIVSRLKLARRPPCFLSYSFSPSSPTIMDHGEIVASGAVCCLLFSLSKRKRKLLLQ
jgi:hypothetical protein